MEEKLSEFLKNERAKRSFTQDEMAQALGITRTYYVTLERGWFNKKRNTRTSAGVKTIRKIAEFTGVTPEQVRTLIQNEKGE